MDQAHDNVEMNESADRKTLDRMRLRIYDVANELKVQPLPTIEDIGTRIQNVATELHRIETELLLVFHMHNTLDDPAYAEKLSNIDTRLAEGWIPEARDADEFVSHLRAQL